MKRWTNLKDEIVCEHNWLFSSLCITVNQTFLPNKSGLSKFLKNFFLCDIILLILTPVICFFLRYFLSQRHLIFPDVNNFFVAFEYPLWYFIGTKIYHSSSSLIVSSKLQFFCWSLISFVIFYRNHNLSLILLFDFVISTNLYPRLLAFFFFYH